MSLWLLIGVALTALVILAVGSVTNLEVRDWGAAFVAALIMGALEWLLAAPLLMAQTALYAQMGVTQADPITSTSVAGLWAVHAAILFVTNTILLTVAALLTPGISVRGLLGLLLGGALLTGIDYATPFAVGQLLQG